MIRNNIGCLTKRCRGKANKELYSDDTYIKPSYKILHVVESLDLHLPELSIASLHNKQRTWSELMWIKKQLFHRFQPWSVPNLWGWNHVFKRQHKHFCGFVHRQGLTHKDRANRWLEHNSVSVLPDFRFATKPSNCRNILSVPYWLSLSCCLKPNRLRYRAKMGKV